MSIAGSCDLPFLSSKYFFVLSLKVISSSVSSTCFPPLSSLHHFSHEENFDTRREHEPELNVIPAILKIGLPISGSSLL